MQAKLKEIKKSCQRKKKDHNPFALPLIKTKGNIKKHLHGDLNDLSSANHDGAFTDSINLPQSPRGGELEAVDSAWSMFLRNLNDSVSRRVSVQENNNSNYGINSYFTESELLEAFDCMKSEKAKKERKISLSDFNLTFRKAKGFQKLYFEEEVARNLWNAYRELLQYEGCTIDEWFQRNGSVSGVLSHDKFLLALHGACDRVCALRFESDEVIVMLKYIQPDITHNHRRVITTAEVSSVMDKLQLAPLHSDITSHFGPVILHILFFIEEQQQKIQEVWLLFVTAGETSMSFEQFCGGVEYLCTLYRPSTGFLHTHCQRSELAASSVVGTSVSNQSPMSVIRNHLTPEELNDYNNYRYYLQTTRKDQPVLQQQPDPTQEKVNGNGTVQSPHELTHLAKADSRSNQKKFDKDSDMDDSSELVRLEERQRELKQSMRQTSAEMQKLNNSLTDAIKLRSNENASATAFLKLQEKNHARRIALIQQKNFEIEQEITAVSLKMQKKMETFPMSPKIATGEIKKLENISSHPLAPRPPSNSHWPGGSNFHRKHIK